MCRCTRSVNTISPRGIGSGCGFVTIPWTSQVNSSSWHVSGAKNPLICSTTTSWFKVWISGTSWTLPFSLIEAAGFVLYFYPFTVPGRNQKRLSFKIWVPIIELDVCLIFTKVRIQKRESLQSDKKWWIVRLVFTVT